MEILTFVFRRMPFKMKSKEEIETSITRSLIDKPEMLKYVTSVPYGFNKPNYEAMSLMVYGYNQCQKDNADKIKELIDIIIEAEDVFTVEVDGRNEIEQGILKDKMRNIISQYNQD